MAQADPMKNSKQVLVELTMPLEEARKFVWQGTRAPREPMGNLVDSKQLDWSDLAWAAQVGYDPKFKEAARTLLAHAIGQPVILQYGPRVIEGSHYLEDQETENLALFFGIFGTILGVAIMAALGTIQQALSGQGWGWFVANILGLLILGIVVWQFYLRPYLEKYTTFRKGRQGEDEIVDRLRILLNNRWTIFRNLHLPGHKDDLDIVLVGPDGVWAIETKSTKSTLRVNGKKWEIQTKGGWSGSSTNPSNEVTQRALQLNDYFKRQGIARFVERAVALSTPQPVPNFENSEIPVWLPATLETQIANLKTKFPPSNDEIGKIVELLNRLAEKQIAIEEAKYGNNDKS